MKSSARVLIRKNDQILLMHRNKFGREYDILIGGAVDLGENLIQAAMREVAEESGLTIGSLKLVFIERVHEPYGTQYVFLSEYVSGEVRLDPNSDEFKINKIGNNLYEPTWYEISNLPSIELLSPKLKAALIDSFKNGFPDQPVDIT